MCVSLFDLYNEKSFSSPDEFVMLVAEHSGVAESLGGSLLARRGAVLDAPSRLEKARWRFARTLSSTLADSERHRSIGPWMTP